jgi:hypothetical protein
MPPNGSLAYRVERVLVTDEDLTSWTVRLDEGVPVSAAGPCPACGHGTSYEVALHVASMGLAGDVDARPPSAVTRVFECECHRSHTAPEASSPAASKDNCGRWWLVTIRLDEEGQRIRAGYDDTLLGAAKALNAQVAAEESSVRSSAEKWIAGVTALYGLFGFSGLVLGKDGLTGLPFWGRLVAAVLAGLGLLLAAVAIRKSYRAAYGWPTIDDVSNDEKLKAWEKDRHAALPKVVTEFRRGVQASLWSVLVLALALGAILFWPRDVARPITSATLADDSIVCGSLLDTSTAGELRIRKSDGTVAVVPFGEVRKIKSVATCVT